MLRKFSEMLKELNEKVQGGEGTIETTHIFKSHELKDRLGLFAELVIYPGCSIGTHEHENKSEIFYVIKGKGVIGESGKQHQVEKGDAVIIEGGIPHSVENNHNSTFKLIALLV